MAVSRAKGHPDAKEGWPELSSVEDLSYILSAIAWTASAHHAAVNFGQADYSSFVLNRSSLLRKPIPAPGDRAYKVGRQGWALAIEGPWCTRYTIATTLQHTPRAPSTSAASAIGAALSCHRSSLDHLLKAVCTFVLNAWAYDAADATPRCW